MTLEEKVGQMTQLAIGMIINGADQNFKIPAKLENAIVKYGVRSILNVAVRHDNRPLARRLQRHSGSSEKDATRNSSDLRHRIKH
jgi:hypothetical protein